MVFSLIAVTLDMDIVISGVQKLPFGRPGASILPSWEPICQLWYALGDHGGSRNDTLGSGQMTESTPWSDWSCGWKALAF